MTRRKAASALPVHMNGRIYDPLLGRFLSADKYVDGVMTVQGYNRYSYVQNNPLTKTDPTGEFAIFGAIIGAAIDMGSQMIIEGKSLSEVNYASVGISAAMGATGAGLGAVVGNVSKSVAKSALKQAAVRVVGNGASGAATGALDAAIRGNDISDGAVAGAVGGAVGSAAGDAATKVLDKAGKALSSLVKSEAGDPSTLGKVSVTLEKASDFKPMDVSAAGTEGAVKATGLASALTVTKDTAASTYASAAGQVTAGIVDKASSDAVKSNLETDTSSQDSNDSAAAQAAAAEAARRAAEEAERNAGN